MSAVMADYVAASSAALRHTVFIFSQTIRHNEPTHTPTNDDVVVSLAVNGRDASIDENRASRSYQASKS